MSQWASGTFWASLIFGWFAAMIFLAVLISVWGSEDMSFAQAIVANIGIQLLSILAGYTYGKHQFKVRQEKVRGFPIIPANESREDETDGWRQVIDSDRKKPGAFPVIMKEPATDRDAASRSPESN